MPPLEPFHPNPANPKLVAYRDPTAGPVDTVAVDDPNKKGDYMLINAEDYDEAKHGPPVEIPEPDEEKALERPAPQRRSPRVKTEE